MSPPQNNSQSRDRDRLFAAWLATAAVVLYFRLDTLRFAQLMFRPTPTLAPWLPLAAYQDLLLIALLSWISWLTLPEAYASARPPRRLHLVLDPRPVRRRLRGTQR